MSELSLDRTTEALTKAQSQVHTAQIAHDTAKSSEVRARAEVFRTQAVQEEARAQRESVTRERDSTIREMRVTDHDDLATLQRLGIERSTLDAQLIALDGATARAEADTLSAQADLDTARAAVAKAEQAAKDAQEKCEEADRHHQEAQLVAAGDPAALARKAASDRARAVLDEHLRLVRSHGVFSPGGGPCEIAVEAEKVRTRLSNRQALDANEISWGSHAEGASSFKSPVGFRGNAPEQVQEGFKPYNTQDPLRNE